MDFVVDAVIIFETPVAIVIGFSVSSVRNGPLVDPEVTLVVDFEFDP